MTAGNIDIAMDALHGCYHGIARTLVPRWMQIVKDDYQGAIPPPSPTLEAMKDMDLLMKAGLSRMRSQESRLHALQVYTHAQLLCLFLLQCWKGNAMVDKLQVIQSIDHLLLHHEEPLKFKFIDAWADLCMSYGRA